ncbi:MAG TPA: thiol reductant ABC exporter subunit CydD, partial [Actinomycetota bacterium]|nr:thiol reductant ABC exporter subunit CydD [Actinomycetota bacterium]
DLRLALVRGRLRDSPLAADGAEAGEVATAAVQGVDSLEAYFARYLPQLVLAALVPVIVLAWTAAVDPLSAFIMLITLPLIPVFMVLIGRATQARTRERWRALSRLSNHFLDVVRGLPTLRAFNRGEAQAERIAATGEEYRETTMQVLRVSFLSGSVLDLLATLATALVAVTLGIRLVDGAVTLRDALIVLLLTPELYAPLRAVAAQFHASADGLAAAERILDLIDDEPGPASAGAAAIADRRLPVPDWDVLRLERVTILRPGRDHPVLDGFDLELRRGEVLALAGPSGCGKSTVASLVVGLLPPDAGDVTVDGASVAALDAEAWRSRVAWLPQRPTLFAGTIRDNIAMGAPAATGRQIQEAAVLAGAHGFIADLPRGYETRVGDGGRALSAGELRRVALARALVRDAPLLVLDEPTANLDERSAAHVADTIRGVAAGRAVLLIEHRADLAAAADRVVRIEEGKAVAVREALRAGASA